MNWPLVVGIGSHHGDDQAGWIVLTQLLRCSYPNDKLVRLEHPTDLLTLNEIDSIVFKQELIICDASQSAERAGTIHHFRWPTDHLAYQRPSGSHDFSLCTVLELGNQLGRLPVTAEIWAIAGTNWNGGSDPSVEVQFASSIVAETIWKSCCHA